MENAVRIGIHEMTHAFYFDPQLFFNYFPEYNGKKYLFTDGKGINKIQGPEILKQIRSHFGCSVADGGKFIKYIKLILNYFPPKI